MKFKDVVNRCHVRSGIYRTGDKFKIYTRGDLLKLPDGLQAINKDKVGKKVSKIYFKNHSIKLEKQVPEKDKQFNDWEEYDPNDEYTFYGAESY